MTPYGLNGVAYMKKDRIDICHIEYGLDELCEMSEIDISDLGGC